MPMQEKIVRAFGTDIHYLEGGDGPPLLLIHGIGECKESWSANLDYLSNHFRLYVPDLVGWGATRPPADFDYTMSSLARFNLAFMDAVGLERTDVIAWSLGGASTLWTMLDAPERFDRVMLIAPAGLGRAVHWSFRLLQLPLLGEILMWPRAAAMFLRYKFLFPHRKQAVTDEYIDTISRNTDHPWHNKSMLRVLRAHHPFWRGQQEIIVRDRLHELQSPVHVLWGRQDQVIPVRHGIDGVKRMPYGELTIFEQCGHMPMLEHRERFHDVTMQFFRRQEDRVRGMPPAS